MIWMPASSTLLENATSSKRKPRSVPERCRHQFSVGSSWFCSVAIALFIMTTRSMSLTLPFLSKQQQQNVRFLSSSWLYRTCKWTFHPRTKTRIFLSMTTTTESKLLRTSPAQQRRMDRLHRLEYNLKIRSLAMQETSPSKNTTSTTSNPNNVSAASVLSATTTEPLESSTPTFLSPQQPSLYAIKVTICDEIRKELHLSGREKRGRVFFPTDSLACRSMEGLQAALNDLFGFLRQQGNFVLKASLPPNITMDNSDVKQQQQPHSWPVESDADVIRTFQLADQFFQQQQDPLMLKRPTILLHVQRDPNAPPVPPRPIYLDGMADPKDSESMTMLSFYAFPPMGISNPNDFAATLRKLWKPFGALGRIYVASEGVNAQMSIPTNVLENFMVCCRSIPELGEYMENGINVDPVPIPRDEFSTAGVPINGKPAPPFRNLHIRVRDQIVADGLEGTNLNWQSAGYDMQPMEWHDQLKRAKMMREQEHINHDGDSKNIAVPLIFDCRNTYETSVGRFEGAIPLETTNFKETWDALKEQLASTPKDAPIMTYCTGGIRCVKVGAYLTQELGFTNVSRLAGGIIAYDRTLNDVAPTEESMFKGTNFVFDGRLGRPITDDALGVCQTCGGETSLVSNCLNDWCHKRMVQCETCRTAFHGTCSHECKQRVLNGAMLARKRNDEITVKTDLTIPSPATSYSTIEDYSMGHSSPIPPFLEEIDRNTRAHFPSGAHMVSGAAQGRLLTELAAMSRGGRILEIGTFTGYATACMLEGAAYAGRALGRWGGNRTNEGPYVMTLERKPESFALAVAHLRTMTERGTAGEEAAFAAQQYRGPTTNERQRDDSDENSEIDSTESEENDDDVYKFVPKIDDHVVSLSYQGVAGCDLVQVNDALATVEAMACGMSDIQPTPFDMVFVDADKVRLLDYAEACISNDNLLKKGGIMVVDNTLWKGLVLEASRGNYDHSTMSVEEVEKNAADLRRNRRARKLATMMHRFNSAIVQDDRVEVRLLTMRDGLSIIRKKV